MAWQVSTQRPCSLDCSWTLPQKSYSNQPGGTQESARGVSILVVGTRAPVRKHQPRASPMSPRGKLRQRM